MKQEKAKNLKIITVDFRRLQDTIKQNKIHIYIVYHRD